MKIRAAVIGLGVGEAHLEAISRIPGCTLVGACDFLDEKLEKARALYPSLALTTKNADDILTSPDIDLVSIATFDTMHAEQICKALESGKHVFVEKPLCLYESEAIEIRRALKAHKGLRLSSNLILRYSPRFKRVKELIDQEMLGKLFYVEGDYNYGRLEKITQGWRGEIPFYSVIHGGGVHVVDLLLWLTGKEVQEVTTFGNKISTEGTQFRFRDLATGLLHFQDGSTGKVTANFGCIYPHFHKISLYGTKATFENAPQGAALYTKNGDVVSAEQITEPYPAVHKGDLIARFVESLINGTPPEVSEDAIFKTMSVCFAMQKSLDNNGEKVSVSYI